MPESEPRVKILRVIARLVLSVTLEQARPPLRRYASSVIAHAHLDGIPIDQLYCAFHPNGRGAVANRVVDKIREDLAEAKRIGSCNNRLRALESPDPSDPSAQSDRAQFEI